LPGGAVCKLNSQAGGGEVPQLQRLAERERYETHVCAQIAKGSLNLRIPYAVWDTETARILQFLW